MPDGIASSAPVSPATDAVGQAVRAVQAASPVPAAVASPAQSPSPATVRPAGQDLRINIVRDQDSGLFVYKFVNPVTGQVVNQIPDEEVLKLRAAAEYSAGRLINTRV